MMDVLTRKVLVAGSLAGLQERLPEILSPPEYALQFTPDLEGAAQLVQDKAFDVLIMEYAESGFPARELLRILRWSGSPCRHATAILFCGPDCLDQAEALVDGGLSRILNPWAPTEVLAAAIGEVLNHELRYPIRALVRINGSDIGHVGVLMTQSLNLSNTGMLIRCDKPVYVGSRFGFSLEAPGLTKAIRGIAAVVRLNQGSSDLVEGFAARFVSFDGDGKGRLKSFLAGQPKPTKADGTH